MVLGVKAQTAASGVRVQGFDCMGGQAHLPGLDTLGYPYVEETKNPAYRLFLRAGS